MKKVPAWISMAQLSKGNADVTIGRSELTKIFPDRGRWHLLDSVRFVGQTAIGEITITEDICGGHAIAGHLIVPGSTWFDVSAQLLGIIAHGDPKVVACLLAQKALAAVEYGAAEFHKPIYPGQTACIETTTEVCLEDYGPELFKVVGGPFLVKLAYERVIRVMISSVALAPIGFKPV